MSVILVTDGLLRKSLSLTRSLGKQGHEVWTADRTRFTPSAFSKYCAGALVHPDPAQHPESYAVWLLQTLSSRKFDLFIPSDDHALEVAFEHRDETEALTKCVLPPT
ncbi:MAG: hypothetical protein ACXVP5_10610, partial [Tumebacillaceae bacterium]